MLKFRLMEIIQEYLETTDSQDLEEMSEDIALLVLEEIKIIKERDGL
jgi:hypothetical protein